eukprot:g33290.t1
MHQQLLVLLANDRSVVSDSEGIRAQINTYNAALFSLDPSSEDAHRVLWEDQPQCGGCRGAVTFEELTVALIWILRSKSPGLDRLTEKAFDRVEVQFQRFPIEEGGQSLVCVHTLLIFGHPVQRCA